PGRAGLLRRPGALRQPGSVGVAPRIRPRLRIPPPAHARAGVRRAVAARDALADGGADRADRAPVRHRPQRRRAGRAPPGQRDGLLLAGGDTRAPGLAVRARRERDEIALVTLGHRAWRYARDAA